MKETGSNRTVDFDYGGDPGGVAGGSVGRELAYMLAKAASDLSQFSGWFDDEFVIDAGFVLENELFDLFFKDFHLLEVQSDFTLAFSRP